MGQASRVPWNRQNKKIPRGHTVKRPLTEELQESPNKVKKSQETCGHIEGQQNNKQATGKEEQKNPQPKKKKPTARDE